MSDFDPSKEFETIRRMLENEEYAKMQKRAEEQTLRLSQQEVKPKVKVSEIEDGIGDAFKNLPPIEKNKAAMKQRQRRPDIYE